MSDRLSSILPEILALATGKPAGTLHLHRLGGGSINQTYQIITSDHRTWFCKTNDAARFPDLFAKENQGLGLLRSQNIIRIPETIACSTSGNTQLLILEWIEPAQNIPPSSWTTFGRQLALLHQVSATRFGLGHDNYMGSLPQSNQQTAGWTEFFIRHRLEPQIRLATDQHRLPSKAADAFERLFKNLPAIFPMEESPSLLHGDLWSGNFLVDRQNNPVLIDPAAYYGHRSIDLAMTTLFGGFDRSFYEAYHHHYPLPPNHRQQWEVCNLYPLLIHLNLFGESYLAGILRTIQPF